MTESAPELRPYTWWIKIRQVPGAPTAYTLTSAGQLWGTWPPATSPAPLLLTDTRLRAYGFERCCCDPTDPHPEPGCAAHPQPVPGAAVESGDN